MTLPSKLELKKATVEVGEYLFNAALKHPDKHILARLKEDGDALLNELSSVKRLAKPLKCLADEPARVQRLTHEIIVALEAWDLKSKGEIIATYTEYLKQRLESAIESPAVEDNSLVVAPTTPMAPAEDPELTAYLAKAKMQYEIMQDCKRLTST